MIIGILSDTHGRPRIAADAIRLLRAKGAEFFIHCGDVGEGVLEHLPSDVSAFVFGNNDWDHDSLTSEAKLFGVRNLGTGGTLTLDGKQLAVAHGDEPRIIRELTDKGNVDYLFTGHTHVPHDVHEGNLRRVNPGALHRAARKTVATLDLQTDALTFYEIGGGA